MPKLKKERKRCIFCGAMKYKKYMAYKLIDAINGKGGWQCMNNDKCVKRSANYKK